LGTIWWRWCYLFSFKNSNPFARQCCSWRTAAR